jgi:hypothetical protein
MIRTMAYQTMGRTFLPSFDCSLVLHGYHVAAARKSEEEYKKRGVRRSAS